MISRHPDESSEPALHDAGALCATVVGHEIPKYYFSRALLGGRLSHAYLFVGGKGIGKRRFASDLARSLLCRSSDAEVVSSGPCGHCPSCVTFDTGNHPGLYRVDPEDGKAIEIDTIRATCEALSIRGHGRRVVLIDGADRMTIPACNALLKTLEEPPPQVLFLLLTSRPAHLLDTIHSRCHRVSFTQLQRHDFEQVVQALAPDPQLAAAFPRLFEGSGGSPGVALNLLAGIEGCGGSERFLELLDGQGLERPESLVEFVPPQGKEPMRSRVRRLVELLIEGHWGRRSDVDPDSRQRSAEIGVELLQLLRDLEGNLNADLVLERIPPILVRHA